MNIKQVEYLNIILIGVSLAIAFVLPFSLFLFAYAVLGPLHFLTQINWLHGKKYYVKTRKIMWVFAVFAFLFAFPFLLELPVFGPFNDNESFQNIIQVFWQNINGLIVLSLVTALSFVLTENKYIRLLIILLGGILAYSLNTTYYYNIWIGVFVPTIIHVYLFTLLFMIYGALKIKSNMGFVAAGLLVIVPFFIAFIDIDPKSYLFSDVLKNTFLSTDFHILNAKLTGVLGLSDGKHFFFYEKQYLKVQIFIAFAYTYHYLNWFSKTSIIGWKDYLTTKNTLVISMVWILSVALYWYDYRMGFIVLMALSVLHVFAEFPLNVVTARGIIMKITNFRK